VYDYSGYGVGQQQTQRKVDHTNFRLMVNIEALGLTRNLQVLFDLTAKYCLSQLNELAGTNAVRQYMFTLMYSENLQGVHFIEWVKNATKYAHILLIKNQNMSEDQAAAYGADKVSALVILAICSSNQQLANLLYQDQRAYQATSQIANEVMHVLNDYPMLINQLTNQIPMQHMSINSNMNNQQFANMVSPINHQNNRNFGTPLMGGFQQQISNQPNSRYGNILLGDNHMHDKVQHNQPSPIIKAAVVPYAEYDTVKTIQAPTNSDTGGESSTERIEIYNAQKEKLVCLNGKYKLEINMDRNAHQNGHSNFSTKPEKTYAANSVFHDGTTADIDFSVLESTGNVLSTVTFKSNENKVTKHLHETYVKNINEPFSKGAITNGVLQAYHSMANVDSTTINAFEYELLYSEKNITGKTFHEIWLECSNSNAVETAAWLEGIMKSNQQYYYAANSVAVALVKAINNWYAVHDGVAGKIVLDSINEVKTFVDILINEDKSLSYTMTESTLWKKWLDANIVLHSQDDDKTNPVWMNIVSSLITPEHITSSTSFVFNVIPVAYTYLEFTVAQMGISLVNNRGTVTHSKHPLLYSTFDTILGENDESGYLTLRLSDGTVFHLARSIASRDVIYITNVTI
jgi:hypothetical protein